jgi:hypothetical protein
MTEPTQAQVAAAVKAMKECSVGGELYRGSDYEAAAKAVLTAAAEVGEPMIHEVQRRALIKCEEIEAATIEHCAQALREYWQQLDGVPRYYVQEAETRIRKLKVEA